MKELLLALFMSTSQPPAPCTEIIGKYVNAGRISCEFTTGSEWKGERSTTRPQPPRMTPPKEYCPPKKQDSVS